jgi:serine/threonine protein kinase
MLSSHQHFDINNLHLGQIIGEGAQASVRLAVDPASSTQIAIKILHKSSHLDLQAVSLSNLKNRQKKSSKSITQYPIAISSKHFLVKKIKLIFIF